MYRNALILLAGLLGAGHAVTSLADPAAPGRLSRLENIVVIYLENHSFDNLYGLFPDADGLAGAARENTLQTDRQGRPFAVLPRVMSTWTQPPTPDPRFPERLPNRPFGIDRYAPPTERIGDPTHRFYQHQAQINGGRMDRFVAESNVGALVMGYYDGRRLPLWDWARRYTLADRFFAAAFGGSFLNHLWLTCACTPRHPQPPQDNTAVLDTQGKLLRDGAYTPDGYAVNTLYPPFSPRSPKADTPGKVLPPQVQPTIGDRLSGKGVTWAWYAGGWDDALAGRADPSFQYHHQPYAYFRRYADGTPDRARHLKDERDFLEAIRRGRLPAVAFYKPLGRYNEHPGDADVFAGEQKTAGILAMLEKSPQWPHMLVIVTYDEHGGFWDHVPPPVGDRFGPGSRVPALLISPFTRGGRIDHTTYDATAILKLIETRFDLEPLGRRDAAAANLADALRF